MPSSTSSFDRPVPDRPWGRLAVVALGADAARGTAGWETTVRRRGVSSPSSNDTRRVLVAPPRPRAEDSTVVIGSSRTVFDLDLDVMEERELGVRRRPPGPGGELARGPMLADLAADESFRGTLVVGVTPGSSSPGGGPPVEKSEELTLGYRRTRSPSQRAG